MSEEKQDTRTPAGDSPRCAPVTGSVPSGAGLIAAERAKQIAVEGYTAAHDDEHTDGEIGMAAACFAAPEQIYVRANGRRGTTYSDPWPWGYVVRGRSIDDADGFRLHTTAERKEGKDRLRQLVIAGALIAAEIDRIQRARNNKPSNSAQISNE
jgi:hypothetical protein